MRKLLLSLLFLWPALLIAQERLPAPSSGQFVATNVPVYQGVRAITDLPASQQHKNTGGRDGAGLCVYTSFWHSAIWQCVAEVYGFRDWMTKQDGGSYPEKFASTLTSYCKSKGITEPGYIQHTGGEEEFLMLCLRTGRMPCVTYCGVDGAQSYGSEVIGHMVNLVYLDGKSAAILDNNFPGRWLWMSRDDFLCRWRGVQKSGAPFLAGRTPIGGGWAITLLNPPPAPYPEIPTTLYGAVGPCVCGDACKCAPGDCPAKCPVLVGQCPNGRCPLQPTPQLPSFVNPIFPPPGPNDVPMQMPVDKLPPGTTPPTELAPGPHYLWKSVPGLGDRWIEGGDRYDWGLRDGKWDWVERPAAKAIGVETPRHVSQFPQGGVDGTRLFAEKRYWLSGEPCSKEEAHAALSLADDSNRWNLTAVGDSAFVARVKGDVAKLPVELRSKVHLQSYAPDGWQVGQFRLSPGLTLRRPAIGRVGANVGVIAATDYATERLALLLSAPGGPDPAPVAPSPMPTPVAPVVPAPVQPTPAPAQPATPAKPADPIPTAPNQVNGDGAAGIALLVGAGILMYFLFFRKA